MARQADVDIARSQCPHCGWIFLEMKPLHGDGVPDHWTKGGILYAVEVDGGTRCPGAGQVPRDPRSTEPLWKDLTPARQIEQTTALTLETLQAQVVSATQAIGRLVEMMRELISEHNLITEHVLLLQGRCDQLEANCGIGGRATPGSGGADRPDTGQANVGGPAEPEVHRQPDGAVQDHRGTPGGTGGEG